MTDPPALAPDAAPAEHERSAWRALVPGGAWLPSYELRFVSADVLAGVTLAAYAIPVALAYATLAGLPPVVGIYGYLLGGIGYALFGSSRYLAVGPTSAISLMVGATVAPMAGGDPQRFAQIVVLASFVVAAMSVVAWLLRASSLTSFISETNLLGFKAGAALTIASTQLAAFFGVPGGGDSFAGRLATVASQIPSASVVTTSVAVLAVVLLLTGERRLPGKPIALGVVVLAIAAVALTPLGNAGLTLVGSVPSGLPSFAVPEIRARDVDGLLPLALACLLLAYIEGVSAARTLAAKHGEAIDPRQELLGLGAANLLVAAGGGYPVAGGLSQSAVNEKAGARSPAALLFASLTLALCLLFLTELVRSLPKAVLAAIVLVAVRGLIDLRGIARLWRVSRFELWVALGSFAGVLAFGILKGIVLAAVASILMLLRRAAFPHVGVLGRLPGSRRLADVARHPDAETVPGVLAVRVEASLLYFNVDHVLASVLRLAARERGIRFVVCDLSSSPHVDLAGARMLASLADELAKRGRAFRVVGASTETARLLRADGLESRVDRLDRFASLSDAVEELAAQAARERA